MRMEEAALFVDLRSISMRMANGLNFMFEKELQCHETGNRFGAYLCGASVFFSGN